MSRQSVTRLTRTGASSWAISALAVVTLLPAGAFGGELSRQDIEWLDRVTYGPTTATVAEYEKLGRRRFLREQLHPKDSQLPQPAAAQIAALDISSTNTGQLLAAVFAEQQRINALTDESEKQAARKALNERGNKLAYEAARAQILRALYSPAQLQEQVTWLWLDHLRV
jgi:hypothetical protein